jgi:hypothetical protein
MRRDKMKKFIAIILAVVILTPFSVQGKNEAKFGDFTVGQNTDESYINNPRNIHTGDWSPWAMTVIWTDHVEYPQLLVVNQRDFSRLHKSILVQVDENQTLQLSIVKYVRNLAVAVDATPIIDQLKAGDIVKFNVALKDDGNAQISFSLNGFAEAYEHITPP